MAYTPINWQTGDTITAEKLNRCDNGWSVESTQLFSETVTTQDTGDGFASGALVYVFQAEPPAEAVVTFDGTDYTVERNADYAYDEAGESGPDFTNYPFYILPENEGTDVFTATAGTHTVAVSAQGIEVSDNFSDAVNAIVDTSAIPMQCFTYLTTYAEMRAARDARRLMYAYLSSKNCVLINSVPDDATGTVGYYPQSGITLQFDGNGILIAES